MPLRHHVNPARWAALVSRVHACPSSGNCWIRHPCLGHPRSWPGMTAPPAPWELASQTAVWYHSGKPPVPIRWVLIQDPRGELDTQPLLCHRPDRRPSADRRMVRPTLAVGGDLPGGESPPGTGDSTPMVGQGHSSHHTTSVGDLLLDYPGRQLAATRTADHAAYRRLVPKVRAHILRCNGTGGGATYGWQRIVFQCRRPRLLFRKPRQNAAHD